MEGVQEPPLFTTKLRQWPMATTEQYNGPSVLHKQQLPWPTRRRWANPRGHPPRLADQFHSQGAASPWPWLPSNGSAEISAPTWMGERNHGRLPASNRPAMSLIPEAVTGSILSVSSSSSPINEISERGIRYRRSRRGKASRKIFSGFRLFEIIGVSGDGFRPTNQTFT